MSEDLHNEVVRRHRGGSSMRQIARRLGISRYQVSRILAAHLEGRESGTSQLPRPPQQRSSCLDEHEPSLQQLLQRQEVADVRIHRETKQRPIDRFADELAHLIPLPAQPYDTAEVVYRCASAEGVVTYCQNRYSVPWRYIGLTLPVRITESEVIIYGPQIEEIARHPLFGRNEVGQVNQRKEHRPSDDSERKYEILKTRYEELGEVASRFFAGLIQRRRYGKSEAHQILALLETYHRRDLLAAIERALRFGAYSRSAIERILAVSATPKTTLDRLAEKEQQQLKNLLDDESVQPRSGKEYQELFDQDPAEEADDEPDTPDEPTPESEADDPPSS